MVKEGRGEFAAAEQLGATLGKREIEQQGDAYRLAALQQLKADPRKAVALAAKARGFYERVRGFNEVDGHLRELDQIRMPALKQAKAKRSYRWR